MLEKKAHRGRLWKVFGGEHVLYAMREREWQGRFWRTPLKKNKKESKVSGNMSVTSEKFWSKSKRSADTGCRPQRMRGAHSARKLGNWESLKEERRKEGKPWEWKFERLRETCEKVAMDHVGRLSIAQEILRKTRTS